MTKKPPERLTADTLRTGPMPSIVFGEDTLTAQLDTEIQEVYEALIWAYKEEKPRRPIWTADGVSIAVVLNWDQNTKEYTPESLRAIDKASEMLGIKLRIETTWEEAALALRDKKREHPVS